MGSLISGGLSLLAKEDLQTKLDKEKMAFNKSQTESCNSTDVSFDSTENLTKSVSLSETLQNDFLQKSSTSKTIYDVCQKDVPKENVFDAPQVSFHETEKDFFQESRSESTYPEVKSCDISFESEGKCDAVYHLENTAKKSPLPSLNYNQIEDESAHFEIRSSDISFQSDEEENSPNSEVNEKKEIREMEENRQGSKRTSKGKSKQEVKELPSNAKQNQPPVVSQSVVESMDDESYERSIHSTPNTSQSEYVSKIQSAVCKTETPMDTSQISHGDYEKLIRDTLRNWLSSNDKTVEDIAQGSEEDIKVKSITNQTESVEKTHVTTSRDPAIVCSENENLISLIDTFRSMCQSQAHIIVLFKTILSARTDNELCKENGSTATNAEAISLSERNEAEVVKDTLTCQRLHCDFSTQMKDNFNFGNIATPSFSSQKCFNEKTRKMKILATSDIKDGAISQAKHCEKKYLNPAGVMQTKDGLIFDESPLNNQTLFKSSCEDQAQCLNTRSNESAMNLSIPKSLNVNKVQNQNQEEQSLTIMGEKIGQYGNAFLKNEEAGNVMKGRDKFKNHADDNTETSSLRRKQIPSKKSNSLRKEKGLTQSDISLSSWRQKESGSSDSDSSEPSTVTERTSSSVKIRKQEKATIQWLNDIEEQCKTSDLQKRDKDCVESVNNHGRLSLAPNESDLCLRFDNLKLDIFNNPSFVNIDLTSKRGGSNLTETLVKTIGGNRQSELAASANVSNGNDHQETTESVVFKKAEQDNLRSLPCVVKGKMVEKSKPRNIQNKPLDKAEMQSSAMHQPKRKQHPNQNTPEEGMTQKGIETNIAHQLDLEGIPSNNQNVASFQNNKTQCLPPSTSKRTPSPGRSNSSKVLDDAKLNPDYENVNHQLLNKDATKLDPNDSLTTTGTPNVLDPESIDLAAVGEMADSIENLVDTLSNFHLSDGKGLVVNNGSEEFCFQNKNFKIAFQPNSNLDNFNLRYESSFSKSALEFKSDGTKVFLEIENN